MGTPAKDKICVQITIKKEAKNEIDKIVIALNELNDPKIGKVTFSKFIEMLIYHYLAETIIKSQQETKEVN